MISPNANGGSLALAMIHKGYAFRGGTVSPLAYTAPLGRDQPKTQAMTVDCGVGVELEAQKSIRRNQASVAMRLCTGMSHTEFAFLARPRATSLAVDSLYLLRVGFLAFMVVDCVANGAARMNGKGLSHPNAQRREIAS